MFGIILSILSIGLISKINTSQKRLLQQVSCDNKICKDDEFCYLNENTGEYKCILNNGM